jgi:hypothetical protein
MDAPAKFPEKIRLCKLTITSVLVYTFVNVMLGVPSGVAVVLTVTAELFKFEYTTGEGEDRQAVTPFTSETKTLPNLQTIGNSHRSNHIQFLRGCIGSNSNFTIVSYHK